MANLWTAADMWVGEHNVTEVRVRGAPNYSHNWSVSHIYQIHCDIHGRYRSSDNDNILY